MLGIGIGILATSSQASNWRSAGFIDKALFDPTSISLTGLLFGQLAMGVLGGLTVSTEYGWVDPGHLRGDPEATRGVGRQSDGLRRDGL